jgi:hypothetical protein
MRRDFVQHFLAHVSMNVGGFSKKIKVIIEKWNCGLKERLTKP